MEYQEILDILKEKVDSVDSFAYDGVNYVELGLGEVKEVDQYGGEGEGENWWSVKHFVDHNVFIKVSGFYQSYNGTEFYNGWEECSEVKPVEKVVTVYE